MTPRQLIAMDFLQKLLLDTLWAPIDEDPLVRLKDLDKLRAAIKLLEQETP